MELERWYKLFLDGNSDYIIKQWTKRSSTIGKRVRVASLSGPIHGRAVKIDKDGALVISNKGKSQRVLVGDLS